MAKSFRMITSVLIFCLFGSCFCLKDIATTMTGFLDELKSFKFNFSDEAVGVFNISSSCKIAYNEITEADAVKCT